MHLESLRLFITQFKTCRCRKVAVLATVAFGALIGGATGGVGAAERRSSPRASNRIQGSEASERAEALIEAGVELRRLGNDADALPKFEQAYALHPSVRGAAQLGLCMQALGRWSDALPLLTKAVATDDDPWVEMHRDVLRSSLETIKQNVGRLEISGEPEGAVVLVNGIEVGAFPLTNPVITNAGSVDIVVKAPGHVIGERSLSLEGGNFQRTYIRLKPISEVSFASNIQAGIEEDVLKSGSSGEAKEQQKWISSPWLWSGIAVFAASVVAGAILLNSGQKEQGPSLDRENQL